MSTTLALSALEGFTNVRVALAENGRSCDLRIVARRVMTLRDTLESGNMGMSQQPASRFGLQSRVAPGYLSSAAWLINNYQIIGCTHSRFSGSAARIANNS
jgi:hypothetical protein